MTRLHSIWIDIYLAAKVPFRDRLLSPAVNQKMFDTCCIRQCGQPGNYEMSIEERVTLTDNEMEALRYAAGFLPRKLLKKYSGVQSKRADFILLFFDRLSRRHG